eukprot:TRINITY_DN127_c0_g1_i1.p1 TRINITY_DN127_c0_g1~~TRINITY_DN127_c0_g1_i1.p1  ORF type:complete len:640 (+),score=209.81 TRINITY_DN127_c0_g1_i1:85-2004(+)
MAKLTVAFLALLVAYASCDLYLQNPRGSNDRLNEANTNRNNANRLFDSQNNAKGGYCIGPAMTFYEGSQLTIEWTVQHGCGSNPKLFCNMVIQYMCGSTKEADPLKLIRDGTTTDTIPDDPDAAAEIDADGLDGDDDGDDPAYKFGMHESFESYQNCKSRNRNKGLYIADREEQGNLNDGRTSAIFTRQNNNGNRHGYECAEERDYYPYWHPSEWKDLAILTSNTDYCEFYQAESQNVKAKSFCENPTDPGVHTPENNQAECTSAGNSWTESPAFGIPPPECDEVPWSRENHLGNGAEAHMNHFNATIPDWEDCADNEDCVCVLRVRYNISTIEDQYPDMSRPDTGFIDWTNNAAGSPILEDPEDPIGDLPADAAANNKTAELSMAVDTSQFGRTFQDRSHTFTIAKRPKGVSGTSRIFNLNVRGKRGNIVQAYPATEYDFVPQTLYTRVGDYVHFQWTGCDTNPAGNAGEGTDQTDRSNMVQIDRIDSSRPITTDWINMYPKKVFFEDSETRLYFATLDQKDCQTLEQLLEQNGNNEGNAEQDERNCGKLNSAGRYFNGGVHKMNKTGAFAYMSTRNHNFSNRDQKGIIHVEALLPRWAIGVVVTGASLFVLAGVVAGLMFYARQNPHSGVANMFSKM